MTPHEVEEAKLKNAERWRQEDLELRKQAHEDLMRVLGFLVDILKEMKK
jgi:hypothetical protein